MAQLTITVRPADVPTLTALADQQWRSPEQQASALIEQALRAYAAKSDPNVAPRRTRSRPARTNGLSHTLAGVPTS